MTIRDILDKFEDYDIRYDWINKILFIYKPIKVKDFIYLRACLFQLKEKLEVRVIDRRSEKIRKYYGGRLWVN